jgi:dihydroneopterin aldolase
MYFLPRGETMSQPENVTPLKIADAARAIRHVFVRDLLLDAHIGVYAHEHGRTQPIRVNVDLTVSEAAHSDKLANVVCYETVVNEIKALVAQGHLNLVETLAEQIATQCLVDERVIVARIRVEKLAAIPEAGSVGVEIERAK